MKVTDKVSANLQNIANNKQARTDKSENAKPEKMSNAELAGSTNLNISPDAKSKMLNFNKIKEVASQAADVNDEKVAKFRNLIDKGLYKVDAEKVADKIVDTSLRDSILETR